MMKKYILVKINEKGEKTPLTEEEYDEFMKNNPEIIDTVKNKNLLNYGNIENVDGIAKLKFINNCINENGSIKFMNKENEICIISNKIKNNDILLFGFGEETNGTFKYGMSLLIVSSLKKAVLDYKFKGTDDFEIYFFCPISKIENKNILINERESNIEKPLTDFIFVGGFDHNINEGKLKIYKIINCDNDSTSNIDIEEITDIEIDSKDFRKSNAPVTKIIQSKIDGKMREGIVFRSLDAQRSFKCVSPEYLIKFHG